MTMLPAMLRGLAESKGNETNERVTARVAHLQV